MTDYNHLISSAMIVFFDKNAKMFQTQNDENTKKSYSYVFEQMHRVGIRIVFVKKKTPAAADDSNKSKEEQAIELLKDLSPEQIMAIISAINK